MKNRQYKKFRNQRGAVIFESVLAICILMLVFFALFQVYKWAAAELFCHYSVFYAAKGASLGYRPNIALRAARVAAIAVSGGRSGSHRADEERAAEAYMQYGDAAGIRYPYWHPQVATDPFLWVGSSGLVNEKIECITQLRNMPLVHEALGKVFGISRNPEPRATGETYNYSRLYLKEE